MKVLVADQFEKIGLDGLADLGVEVLFEPNLKDDALRDRLAETQAQILVVRSTKVTAAMIDASKLGLIIRAGAGYNTIDVAAASERGIYVANCPGKNSQAVAELAFGLMLAADRHIPDNVATLREGRWNKKGFSKANGLFGRTLGIVGMGAIGQEVAARAKAFGMDVVVYSRYLSPDGAAFLGVQRAASLEELAAKSDFVSVHTSLTDQTRGLLGASFFQAMKPGAVFVNTSRAEVVDQSALLAAIESRGIFAALDVFDGEPTGGEGDYDGPLRTNPSVYCTHHIGASTEQAQEAVAHEVVRIVREYLSTGVAPNVVNLQKSAQATHLVVVRHADRVGVLAHVLQVLRDEGINVQEMENIVLAGAKAAIAQIATDKAPTPNACVTIRMNANVFDVTVNPIAA